MRWLEDGRTGVIEQLREQIRGLEQCSLSHSHESISTGIDLFDRFLPDGGWQPGTLVEWLGDEGSCAGTAALASVLPLLKHGALVVVDERLTFYPPALQSLVIDLQRIVFVRPAKQIDALWAVEQSLRCRGVAATCCWLDRPSDQVLRRLQLAAETGSGVGLLLRPMSAQLQPSWAHLRLLVQPLPSVRLWARSVRRRLRVQVLHSRGRKDDAMIDLELSDETGFVHLASPLAASASAADEAGSASQDGAAVYAGQPRRVQPARLFAPSIRRRSHAGHDAGGGSRSAESGRAAAQ